MVGILIVCSYKDLGLISPSSTSYESVTSTDVSESIEDLLVVANDALVLDKVPEIPVVS